MNKQIIQDYRNFNAFGLNDTLSEEDKEIISNINKKLIYLQTEVNKLEAQKKELLKTPVITDRTIKGKTYSRKLLAFDVDFKDPYLQAKIFSHGKSNYNIWFLNKANKLGCVDTCRVTPNGLIIYLMFDVKNRKTSTYMKLDRFLYFVEQGEFRITNNKFNSFYMKPYEESNFVKTELKKIDSELNNLSSQLDILYKSEEYKKYAALYNNKKIKLKTDYNNYII